MPNVTRSDPNNAYHELRRFLFSLGISTRVGSYMSCPLPRNLPRDSRISTNAQNFSAVDNFFIFELRRVFETDSTAVNAVAFLCRIFFHDSQDGNTLHVQLVCNHRGHGTLEMSKAYDDVVGKLLEQNWTLAPYSSNILSLERRFESIREFKQHFLPLYGLFKKHDVLNKPQLPSEMQG
jgi:hypothetical protein